jgi:hypothetical protein
VFAKSGTPEIIEKSKKLVQPPMLRGPTPRIAETANTQELSDGNLAVPNHKESFIAVAGLRFRRPHAR